MSFKIKKDGVAVPINTLDETAAKFFGVMVDKESYASPLAPKNEEEKAEIKKLGIREYVDYISAIQSINWYDTIGFWGQTSDVPYGQVPFDSIKERLSEYNTNTYFQKILDLCDWFKENGYTYYKG